MTLQALFEKAERDILKALSGALTAASEQRYRAALKQVRAALDGLRSGSRDWADEAMATAYREGMTEADAALVKQGAPKAALTVNPVNLRAIAAMADDAVDRVDTVANVVYSQASRAIREAQSEALLAQMSGQQTTRQAARLIRQRLEADGMAAFVDRSGREWTMKRYSDMLARTASQQAQTAGTVGRLVSRGYDLATFTDVPTDTPACATWKRRVVSLTGATEGYPTLAEAREAGILHPNCRHRVIPYIPDPPA